jgi:hypothetical protein
MRNSHSRWACRRARLVSGSHPNAVSTYGGTRAKIFASTKSLDSIPARASSRARARFIDEPRCALPLTGTFRTQRHGPHHGIPPGIIKAKNKPNWDTYDSWGGACRSAAIASTRLSGGLRAPRAVESWT